MSEDKALLIESLFMFKALYAGFDKVLGHSLIPSLTPWDDLQQRIEDHLNKTNAMLAEREKRDG